MFDKLGMENKIDNEGELQATVLKNKILIKGKTPARKVQTLLEEQIDTSRN